MGDSSYERAADGIWRPFRAAAGDRAAERKELIRYATLAPSSHNTQCWRFEIKRDRIVIRPDLARRCPVVDPDDHHLFVSLGCAAENIVQAASAQGYHGDVHVDAADGNAVVVVLEPAPPRASALFDAIPFRQNTRTPYDATPVAIADMRALERAGTGTGVRIEMLTTPARRSALQAFVVEGNTAEDSNPAFVAELRRWIRFNDADAIASGDGLLSRLTGNPALPGWLGGALLGLFLSPKSDGKHYASLLQHSAAIAIFISERDDVQHWVQAGRAYQHFALQATALGIRMSMLNQAVEVAPVRARFAAAFGFAGGRPDLIVRFGHGPPIARSLRRPLGAVLVA
jgi:nitroreductase